MKTRGRPRNIVKSDYQQRIESGMFKLSGTAALNKLFVKNYPDTEQSMQVMLYHYKRHKNMRYAIEPFIIKMWPRLFGEQAPIEITSKAEQPAPQPIPHQKISDFFE